MRSLNRSLLLTIAALLLLAAVCAHAQGIVGPDQMNYCDIETFTTTITNASVAQSACVLEIVRSYTESGVDYVPGSTTITLHDATVLTDDPTANAWDIDALLGSTYTLPPTESITIAYDLATSCAAVSGTEQVTANYEDCADPDVPLQNVSSTSIEILPGAIVVSKLPSVQDARVGDLVTWTITVKNTGLGRVDNVTITDVLGPGLAYSSSTDGGSNAGQTTTWDIGSIALGESESVDLSAEVISCAGLYNDVDAAFGCGPADICFDTAIDQGTATASLNLIVDNPALSFTPPNVTVGYCTDETAGMIQITNSGAGTARNVELCCDLAHLEVDTDRLPPDTTYAGGCFQIPDIAPGATFDLTFYVLHADVDWCNGPLPSGDNVFQLTYTNDCDVPFVAFPQFSTLSTAPGPSLAVTKSGPDSLRLGETGSYDITVEYVGSVDCGGGSPGPVTIVDTYPEGFTVIDPAGGTVDAGARTITWAYDPNVDPPFDETVQLEAPTDCSYCAGPGGGSDANAITATGTDCCGCPITGTASDDTTILCEGFGDIEYFSSSMALDRSVTVRCSMDYAVTITHSYTFIDDPALDDFLLDEFTYFVDGNGDLAYVPGSASVTGGTLGTVTDNTPAGRLELPLTDSTSVRNRTIIYEYTLIVQDLDSPSCQASTVQIDAGVDLEIGAPDLGLCGSMYADPAERLSVTAQPPAMNVTIAGIPEIQEFCATYPVTITLTRTSTDAKPYDARIVLTNNGGSILDFTGANCGGGTYSPTDGTTCTGPHVDVNTYEWRYADLFDNENETAQITFDVTVPCNGPLADLSVVAIFDDLCHDDETDSAGNGYGNPPEACTTSDADAALLSLSANVFTRKSPEILYATTRDVEWTLVVHNTGNAAAYNVWVDDRLGSGLVFDQASTVAPGATITANQDHLGGVINGATFLFDSVDPGELIEITFAADLVACDGLTNDIAVSWGCGGADCQTPRTDGSIVVVPPANLVATTFSPTPVPMCARNSATTIAKNAGVSTVYGIVNAVTLPNGLTYLTGPPDLYPEVRVNGGSWSQTGEPDVSGQTLTWTSTETPELAFADPNDIIEIRFNYTAFCDFAGGSLSFLASYEDPCGDVHTSDTGTFSLGLEPASLSTTLRQIDPAPGEALDCGGEATWEIDVVNTGAVELAVIQVEAILDAGLTFISSEGDSLYGPADDGAHSGQSVYWEFEDLPVGATATLTVTAAAAAAPGSYDCEALAIDVIAAWGCGEDVGDSATFDADCTTTSPETATIEAIRRPPLDLTAALSPDSIESCADTTELTLTITNTSTEATTSNVDFVITLPDDLSYVGGSSEIDCGAGYGAVGDPNAAGQTLTWYDIAAEGVDDDGCASIPPGGTIRLRFDVDVSCFFTTQDIPITVYSYDCCGLTQYDTATSVTLTSLLPTLTMDKSPVNTDLDCYDAGDTVTWTLTVTNNGTGIADWVRLVDTLGSALVVDSFTDLVDETPSTVAVGSLAGQTITWEADISLAPGESLSATVTAYAVQPSDDCARAVRRNTAVATWGCATLAAPTCEYGTAVQDLSTVRVPNLDIDPADITPVFDCTGDGITPGSGQLQITVRNQGNGDAPITEDFAITVSEPNAGFSVTDTFVGLGGVLPLNDNSPQTLTLDGWNVSCANCTYAVTVTLDAGDTVCECQENDNAATLTGDITLPDLVIDSANLSVTCASDGQVRIQGPVTLRNDGCGDPLTGDLSLRLRLFDAADCAGNEIDTFTVSFTGLNIASGGGTAERTIDVTRTLDLCDTCVLSIRLEADEDDAVCECNGTNNDLCAGTFPIATPDLTITDIDFSQITCTSDGIAGVVRVTVQNDGCGSSGPFDLRLETDGCLSFDDETVAALGSGASTTVDFAVTGDWADCADCSCTFTATVDPDQNVCECDGTSNDLSEPFTSSLPDLEISGVIGSLGCATDGQGTVDADVTVANTGCADVTASFDIAVTVYDGPNCTGNIVDSWSETISGETVPSGGSTVVSLNERVVSEALCAGDCDYSAHFVVDSGDDICECDGTDNEFCLSSIPSEVPDLVVTEVDPAVDCVAGTATVSATVGNVGCGDATGVIFRLTNSGCAPTLDSDPIDLASGASEDVVFTYTPDCDDWNCTFTVTADPSSAICECDGANSLTLDPYPGIGSIGDRVWLDTDAEGDQDPAELGIANVTVILEADLDADGIIDYTAETTTDANGEYLFDDLPAGDYTITVDDTTLPDGMEQTYDYDGLGTPHTSDYTLAENEHNREQDFGYRGLGSIGDYVWIDANADGVQDPTEVGIENVTITLEGDLNGDGIPETLTTTTDADGLYLFDVLPAGPYTITVDDTTLPAGLSQTYDYDGLGTPHTCDYTLGAGEHNREQDFGYASPALSVDKVITDILRGGASIGSIIGPVEPGDVIVYRFTIENVGPVPAYQVGFDDTLPAGIVIETDAPGDAGSYVVSDPSASGSLALTDGATTFNVPLGLPVNAGETLTATFTGIVTSSVSQGDDLTNTAHAYGEAEDGTPIPPENALLGDASDSDVEDPDADDTGIVTVSVLQPALSVDKTIVDIVRPGIGTLGAGEPVEPGDVVFYRFVIRNVGGATAYDVEFTDTLPSGMVTETDAPGDEGSYVVSDPAASGSLGLADGVGTFTTAIDAEIGGGESLTADFSALITSGIVQGVDLVNTAEATGFDGFGTEIPDENPAAGDEDDDDIEDPDADDTGIAIIGTEEPALSVDKIITDIVRSGSSIGSTGPVEPGDIVFYQYTIRNVGLGTAYDVEFTDTLPTGLITETDAPGDAGSWTVDAPSASGGLGVPDSVDTFTTSIDATIAGGGQLVADYTVFVTSDIEQGVNLVNVAAAVGIDGAGNPIPGENADVGDLTDDDAEDGDADDTGITIVASIEPALSVDKRIVDVIRSGESLGVVAPILYGDILVYQATIRNVGLGTAYDVEFTDTLPAGLETETNAPGTSGTYTVTSPSASGDLVVPDGVSAFATSIDATLDGGASLTATYTVLITPAAPPSQDLVNTVSAVGVDGAGTPIQPANPSAGDTSDDDVEDPDADDTGIASIRVGVPALVTDKSIANVTRAGAPLGAVDVIQEGDTVTYDLRITNVGDSTAFNVDVRDILPSPFVYVGGTTVGTWPLRIGDFTRDPSGAPGPTILWDTDATLAPGETLALRFDALIDGPVGAGETYTNVLEAEGRDGADRPIPPNSSDRVPADDDPDDRDEVSLIGGADAPALVTTKAVAEIRRDGVRVHDGLIEVGDEVQFELTVRNVGPATAYDVGIDDQLPIEFSYEPGTTNAQWPSDSSSANPAISGPNLVWDLGATLRSNDLLTLRFEVDIVGPLFDGLRYVNRMHTFGEDGSGSPIPPDQRSIVPGDIDPDDASEVDLTARSSFVRGEGGEIIPVPILRKTAEVLGEGACEGTYALTDRVWFQTDIAMFASTEFEELATLEDESDLDPSTYLPTWVRTVRTEAAAYALDNLIQVEVLSGLGLSLAEGPRMRDLAEDLNVSHEAALETRLNEIATRAGLPATGRPSGEDWIYLEFAGGEPVYATWSDGALGPYGDWTVLEEEIVGSAVGMSLLKQATEADVLLASSRPLDRYVGLVLAEAMASKLLALDETLMIRAEGETPYLPHAYVESEELGGLALQDGSSHLLDQLSYLWGLARFAAFLQANPSAWSAAEAGLRAFLHARTLDLIGETLTAIDVRHLPADGSLVQIADGASPGRASMPEIALLLVALDEAAGIIALEDLETLDRLSLAAREELLARAADGKLFEPAVGLDTDVRSLLQQTAGIRGFLVAAEADVSLDWIGFAQAAFDVLDETLWIDDLGRGLYAEVRFDGETTMCYTPFEIGLATGALRELALRSDGARRAHILGRLSSFLRSIVDDAALQLSNATAFGSEISVGTGLGSISPLRYTSDEGPLAPVLQEQLCLDRPDVDTPCAGRTAELDEPWYQTDISMYASFVLQDRMPEIEDYADANLSAVVLHSNLGIGLDERAARLEASALDAQLKILEPFAIPFAGGSPKLADGALGWNAATFDDRVLASAVGMTLLREAQEVRQLLADLAEPDTRLLAEIYLAAIAETLSGLDELTQRGPEGVDYIPHAARWTAATSAWIVEDASTTLFDQLSLLYGLSETYALLTETEIIDLIDASTAADYLRTVEILLDRVLSTMERTHIDPAHRVLLDEASPASNVWSRGDRVTTSTLGLTAAALEHAADVFSGRAAFRTRILSLLTDEVRFLQERLWLSPGVYRDAWSLDDTEAEVACTAHTLLGQLGALRALLAANALLDLESDLLLEVLAAIEARFWNETLQLYPTQLETLTWCVTPLDLGMAIDSIDRAAELLETEPRGRSFDRLMRHVDRTLDALWLQLPDTISRATEEDVATDAYAPVFDRRVCLRGPRVEGAEAWAQPGDLIRYSVTAENPTETAFADLLLEDRLPAGVSLVSADPAGTDGDGTVSWPFDRFEAGESRTWTLIGRIDESVENGEILRNCATLTYFDLEGSEMPPREACAETAVGTADGALGEAEARASVSYRTDEAMRLATALDELAKAGAEDWPATDLAREVSLANLGVLLAESGLGLPFDPMIDSELNEELRMVAASAGLETVPPLGAPIDVPFSSGTPRFAGGHRFAETSDVVTPAALGWTLTLEAAFLASPSSAGGLTGYLRGFTALIAERQIDWLAAAMQPTEAGGLLLPGAGTTSRATDVVTYTTLDEATTAGGQAALLLGLLRIAEVDELGRSSRLLAEQLASEVLQQLLQHSKAGLERPAERLSGEGSSEPAEPAAWAACAAIAEGLRMAVDAFPREAAATEQALRDLGSSALAAGPQTDLIEEAGRLSTLLRVARTLEDPSYAAAALSGWEGLRASAYDASLDRLLLRPGQRVGLVYTPGELAVVFELLLGLARAIPEEMPSIYRAAASILEEDVIASRVQLADPNAFWTTHMIGSCRGIAPVFGRFIGELPLER